MSRIGKLPVSIVPGVKVSVDGDRVAVEGPKGRLAHVLPRGITAGIVGQQLTLERRDDSKSQKALHGLMRALVANAVVGVSQGYNKKLEIHGVGYSGEVKGRSASFKLGYSHVVVFPIPQGIEIRIDRSLVTVEGFDRQQVGQVAAEIRALRPPDVYKQKGIRYAGEALRKKAGKAGGK